MNDERALGPELDQGARDRLTERGARNAEEVAAHASGIRKRTEHIEDGTDADLAPHGRGVAHRGVEARREHEADPHLPHALGDAVGPQIDLDPERLEHVRAAAPAGCRAVAVLRDPPTRTGDDERGDRGDVDAVRTIATGPDDVDRAVFDHDAQRIRAERARESRDLVGSLAPDVQRREERAELRRGRLTGHHGPHRRLRLGSGQRLARPDEAEGLTRVQGSSPT